MTARSRKKPGTSSKQQREATKGDASARARALGPRRRWPLFVLLALGVLVVVAAVGFFGRKQLSPVPAVVAPDELERLDPQFREYAKQFIEWAEEAPDEAGRHSTLGLVYEANERWADAHACFKTAVELDPNVPLARYHLALVTLKLGNVADALATLRQITERFVDFAPAHHRLGVALLETGAIEEAGSAFGRAIALAPGDSAGYIGLADVKLRQKDYARAAELLEKALEIKPRDGTARHLLGMAYRGLGRQVDAEREFSQEAGAGARYMPDAWTKELPKHAKGLGRQIRRAMAFLNAGQYAKAAELFETALAWRPGNVALMNNLAIAYMRLGQLDQALDLLLRAERTNATHAPTRTNLASCLMRLSRFEEALEYADRAIRLAPKVAKNHTARTRALTSLGRHLEALESSRTAAELDPQNAGFQMRLGAICIDLNRHAEAKQHYKTATRLAPAFTKAYLGLCDACLNLEHWDEAAEALRTAQKLAPQDPNVIAMAERVARRTDP